MSLEDCFAFAIFVVFLMCGMLVWILEDSWYALQQMIGLVPFFSVFGCTVYGVGWGLYWLFN